MRCETLLAVDCALLNDSELVNESLCKAALVSRDVTPEVWVFEAIWEWT